MLLNHHAAITGRQTGVAAIGGSWVEGVRAAVLGQRRDVAAD